ncbi:MAG: hydroxymethylbilane synthase [Betaproteobacteria bacterium]|nr:hydroxymethylbilane synthase [Betaproteobacteria bacterium]
MWQAEHVKSLLERWYPDLDVRILGMTTQGDRILDKTLNKIGGKGLFVKELEEALAQGRADLAVHSMKDVPMALPEGFCIAAIGPREDPRDAFVSNRFERPAAMPPGSILGTSSLRRQSQLLAAFPHLEIRVLRGNVGTRLKKLDEGQYDAIILAKAGLERLGLAHRVRHVLDPETSLPAVGQGALGIECRADRADVQALLRPFNDEDSARCVTAERAMSRALNGSCQVPLGAYARIADGQLRIRGFVASPDGRRMIRADRAGDPAQAETLGKRLAAALLDQGAGEILEALEEH